MLCGSPFVQLNRVVRHNRTPVPPSRASIATARPATQPQPSRKSGTRATSPRPTNTAVAPVTSAQSSQVRRRAGPAAPSPASPARTTAGSMP